jgi:cytochrome P450 family 4
VLQRKVYNEIVEVLGNSEPNVAINHANLQELKYLEMVIKETLRMYPSVPIIGRNLAEDTEIGEF